MHTTLGQSAAATDHLDWEAPPTDPLAPLDSFLRRHLGSGRPDIESMLSTLGVASLEELADSTVPDKIRLHRPLELPAPRGETKAIADLRALAGANRVLRSYIGLGYHDTITPPVIQRNILENPGWYTAYTPYQAEIAQGRLEALLNFQTMITDLTGMDIANASLLDEATAAAEAATMCFHNRENEHARTLLVCNGLLPQTLDVVDTRCKPLGITVRPVDFAASAAAAASATASEDDPVVEIVTHGIGPDVFAILLQYPTADGAILDYREVVKYAKTKGARVIVAADLLSLTLLTPPGEWGADICVGSAQRFGVPLGFGGPHAGYFATKDAYKRQMPGRLVGVSHDSHGRPALRLSLQTREQHIRREKATSNICTAQVLLAVMASMYAVYHGPRGLKNIASRIHRLAGVLAGALKEVGCIVSTAPFFDTLHVLIPGEHAAEDLEKRAEAAGINLRHIDASSVGISINEKTTVEDLRDILRVFAGPKADTINLQTLAAVLPAIPEWCTRTTPYLTASTFQRYHTEHEMLRYMRKLESKDLSLTTSMIPLGSCTMKLNATSEMFPVSWPEIGGIHPFAPESQTAGYREIFKQLEEWLAEITGMPGISLQPNAGSQGEFAGLLAIRAWHEQRGQGHRNVCLIPTSAHGTNPASAVMAGFVVVTVACDSNGNVDLADLAAKAEKYSESLSCIMVTYPSTHGVFEEGITEITRIVHDHGGQVYMDGANLTAQVGLCRPGDFNIDVIHMNLHKTFCIPHGGGGPGVGPIAVAAHLVPFLPGHALVDNGATSRGGATTAAPWGSASILVISWMYIAMLGAEGLTAATKLAILNANYMARRLESSFPILYKGSKGFVAHECILDLRGWKKAGVEVEDVAKRLMDYGFHAPTVSWPVPGTVMVEPTESESKEELDRFIDAMISIRAEIQEVVDGKFPKDNNPLKNAPHTALAVTSDDWQRPYGRQQAAFPTPATRDRKFWPAVGRIDNVYGDRNLVCSCAPLEDYEEKA
ncbi:MAG TPA: aminomethyl-transferring glycine dehydrogenase [Candidatus Methylacidiphilales bacterium]|nr:aminomethyl-transferring glycine dehydrogenase [Candidatus Methylacidiphilales bacterium]